MRPVMPNSDGSAPGQLKRAVWLGSGLLGFTLVLTAVLCGNLFAINRDTANYQPPLAIGVLAGFVMVIVALAGLVLIFNALGLSDTGSALGLPSGSIRALLALSLVTVFVGVCSADLLDPQLINADAGKQILSISATALTTIIGFYFGSNSANEAFSAANQAASAASGSPPTLGDLQTQAASVEAIADGLKQKLDAVINPDPDRIAQQNPDAAALAAL